MQEETYTSRGIAEDTRRGLLDRPKWLSSLYFYDEAGSRLFERICETEEYYPTRTERGLLAAHADDILAVAGDELVLAELGSGSSAKTRLLLEAILRRQRTATYLPVDVSAKFLAGVAAELEASLPGLHVVAVAAEYKDGLRQIGAHATHAGQRRLVLFLGSSIGNFEPGEQVALLRAAHDALSPGDTLLLGTDMVKDAAVLEAAYNDAAGYTAAFNRNILAHLARELDGDADPEAFDHVAFWNPKESRIEMHLRARRDQVLRFAKARLEVPVQAGETIHTENSYKYTPDGARALAEAAGWRLERSWTDMQDWFCLHLLRRP